MEDLIEDFLKGDEVKSVKTFVAKMSVSEIAVLVAIFVGILLYFPKLTICTLIITVGSMFAAHTIKKWVK